MFMMRITEEKFVTVTLTSIEAERYIFISINGTGNLLVI